MDIRFERAAGERIPLLRDLAGRIWRAYYPGTISPAQIEHMLSTMYSAETLARELASHDCVYEVVVVDARAVGYLSWWHRREPHALRLAKLYLDPALHGRGLGARMLAHVDEIALQLGCTHVDLLVNQRNVRAIRAYERAGYAIEAAEVGDAGAGFVMEDWRMAKVMVPPATGIPRAKE